MIRILLQNMVENLGSRPLPTNWSDFDLATFSSTRSLWDFQQEALSNALVALWQYFGIPGLEPEERKHAFMKWYWDFGLDFDLNIRLDRSTARKRELAALVETYYTTDEDDRIPYEQFINRMSFWMATGSGKSLVIVKLIEILRELMRRFEIPVNDILILTYREDLLEQLKEHVKDFNDSGNLFIRLYELREYPEVKRQPVSLFNKEEIRVFYYRSDNLSDEQKEKIIDFRSYDNHGNWYVLLDEAHKGDKEDAKSQQIFSILTRNGFLFNFSATFTDPRDIATTVYNYNLEEFIQKGHGKHLAILKQEAVAFRRDSDFSENEKQKIVLKALMMLAYTREIEAKVRSVQPDIYHRSMMMTLVNSVNTEDADLKLFFREIARIGLGEIDPSTWRIAKDELIAELSHDTPFEYEPIYLKVNHSILNDLSQADLLKNVFNADSSGEIEILVRASDKKELALQLTTGTNPFALVRIGDVSDWLRKELAGYGISQHLADESYFSQLNRPESDINILLGSRSFYEGWDSNRPNVITYINIGVSEDAKKFILQSVGRGVRIEPFKNKRKRIETLAANAELTPEERTVFDQIQGIIQPLETVYIFGTNREALELVIKGLGEVSNKQNFRQLNLSVNSEAVDGKILLIPRFQMSTTLLSDDRRQARFALTEDNINLLDAYTKYLDDNRVFYALHGTTPKQIGALREALNEKEETFRQDGARKYKNLDVLVRQSLSYFGILSKELIGFKPLDEEIKHFKQIKVLIDAYDALDLQITRLMDSANRIRMMKARYDPNQISMEDFLRDYDNETSVVSQLSLFSFHNFQLELKQLVNHYYIPVLLSRSEKIDYISSVIQVPSEVQFMHDLEAYLKEPENGFTHFDWWLFSKLDEHQDEVQIPYYNAYDNKIFNFKPDFIFWLKQGDKYHILFVDPKGTSRNEYQHKVDGFRQFFEVDGQPKVFEKDGLKVYVHLGLYTADRQWTAEYYQRFWYDSIKGLVNRIL